MTVDAILGMPATWFNLEAVMHHLWGQARAGQYDKQKWAAFHALLLRVRARSA